MAMAARRFRQEAQAFSLYCEQHLKKTKTPPNCTHLLDEILADQTLITGFANPDSNDFNQGVLIARIGSLFGSYAYVDQQNREHPTPIANPASVQFRPFPAGKADALLRFVLPSLYVPFSSVRFLGEVAQCVREEPSDEAVFIQSSIDAGTRRKAPGTLAYLATLATSAAFMVPLHSVSQADNVVPRDKDIFAKQPVNGDGACLYRSIAVSLLYSLTGVLFDHTVAFSEGILANKENGWRSENYSASRKGGVDDDSTRHRLLIALSVNILTLWVKFYTYVVACTAIPANRVTWDRGIVDVRPIYPITDPYFYFLPHGLSVGSLPPGSVPVPSLACVVKVAAFLHELKDEQGRFASWDQVKPIVAPWLISLPWDSVPNAPTPPDKTIREFVPTTRRVENSTLSVFAAINISNNLDPTQEQMPSIWSKYCENTRQFRYYGGQEEAWMFSSLLADAYARGILGVAKVEIYKHQDVVPTTQSQQFKIIVPVVVGAAPMDRRQVLTVVYNNVHYDSIINSAVKGHPSFAQVERDMNFPPEATEFLVVQKVNVGNHSTEWQVVPARTTVT